MVYQKAVKIQEDNGVEVWKGLMWRGRGWGVGRRAGRGSMLREMGARGDRFLSVK